MWLICIWGSVEYRRHSAICLMWRGRRAWSLLCARRLLASHRVHFGPSGDSATYRCYFSISCFYSLLVEAIMATSYTNRYDGLNTFGLGWNLIVLNPSNRSVYAL